MLADISMEVILGIPFLSFSNANVEFTELEKFNWRFYITAKALPTTSQIKLIYKREFAKVALDKSFETFVMYVANLKATRIHSSQGA